VSAGGEYTFRPDIVFQLFMIDAVFRTEMIAERDFH